MGCCDLCWNNDKQGAGVKSRSDNGMKVVTNGGQMTMELDVLPDQEIHLGTRKPEEEQNVAETEEDPAGNKTDKLPQALAAVAANLMILTVGSLLTWTSPANPMLQKDDSPFRITDHEGAWVGSLLALGSVFGGPPFGWLVNRVGRKLTILSLAAPVTVSWILTISTRSVLWLYVARFIAGLSLGGVSFVVPIYVAEVAEPSVRGPLSSITQVAYNTGILYAYAVGAVGNYMLLNFACLLLPILFVLVFVWMPEAPQYCLAKDNRAGAAKALQWLRGKTANVEQELQHLKEEADEAAKNEGSLSDLMKDKIQGSQRSKVLPQYVAALAANLASATAGCVLGWTSPALPKIKDTPENEGWVTITENESSWIGSLAPLGSVCGPFLAGYLADKIGRRMTLLGTALPFILSWALLSFASAPGLMYFSRLLLGIAVGMVFTVLPMYVGEISENRVRGSLGSLMQLLIVGGILFEYVLGPYVSYTALIIGSGLFPIFFAVAFYFVPESPYQHIANGQVEEAAKSLMWLRGQNRKNVQEEINSIQASLEETLQNKSKLSDLIATRGNIKALYLSLGLVTFQQLSGINAVLFYSQDIFRASGSSISPAVATIIVGVVMFLASAVTPLVVDKLGRRLLLLVSAIIVLGVYFKMSSDPSSVENIGWLPVVSLVIYIIVYSIGFGPLPWAVMGELFPTNVKSNASACTAAFCWFIAFFITKFFGDIAEALGSHTAFWIFAGCTFIAAAFVFFLLPETKGKSLQEIQDILNK
ncbi:hypothetical protein L9F63_023370 [Diploptera punctata]|uniref:Major facilitator superfamily (MFS) profile domain-containing protein n=1 Tax=Diploptera punctata TaxID=6984 RepID=A0AAD7ZKB8_DIPPU|nr:hypothetical protein L9F63_023370 [Diploptera punctata]